MTGGFDGEEQESKQNIRFPFTDIQGKSKFL